MRLSSVRIQNFRAFSDQHVHFNNYTCLVGPNGGGKSTVLQALNVFFQETAHSRVDLLKLEKEDFHHKDYTNPAIITVTFEDLSPDAQAELKDYYRNDKLIISAKAEWSEDDNCAPVVQYGLRLGIEDFKPFFKAEGDKASVKELKEVYSGIREKYDELPPPGTKQAMIDALHAYEADDKHKGMCVEIPSEDQFYGISKGVNRLRKFVQWVFIPALKDASDEEIESKKSALGALLERTVRMTVGFKEPLEAIRQDAGDKYQKALLDNQPALAGLSESLSFKLGQWAHPDTAIEIEWRYDAEASVRLLDPYAHVIAREGAFKGKLTRFGHGMQRSFLLSLLEELAGGAVAGPKLILGCEEPELYQHPPQARHLSSVFQKLASKNSQVIVCTHSPYFVSGREVQDIRSIRPDTDGKCCRCHNVTIEQVSKSLSEARGEPVSTPHGMILKIQQALQPALNELFFANVLVLVEGLEDVAYITAQLTLAELWDEFRRYGCHLVAADGKSSIAQPLAIASHMKIPTFVLFDSDGHSDQPDANDSPEKAASKTGRRTKHEKDNIAILKLCGIENPVAFPAETLWHNRVVMWSSEIGDNVERDIGKAAWISIRDEVCAQHGVIAREMEKNGLFIGYRLLKAWEQNKKSETLEKLCEAILTFAREARLGKAAAQHPAAVASSDESH